MIKFNKSNVMKIIIVLIGLAIFLFVLLDRQRIYLANNSKIEKINSYLILKNYYHHELELQSRFLGKEVDYKSMTKINEFLINERLPKLIFVVDGASCKPCYKEIITKYFRKNKIKNASELNIMLIIGSKNLKFAEKYTEEFLKKIPILVDQKFTLRNSFNLDNGYTISLLLDVNNICTSVYIFRKDMDILNEKKIEILSDTFSRLN